MFRYANISLPEAMQNYEDFIRPEGRERIDWSFADTLGQNVFSKNISPQVQAVMVRKIMENIRMMQEYQTEQTRAAVESARASLEDIFARLTYDKEDGSLAGDLRVALLLCLDPVQTRANTESMGFDIFFPDYSLVPESEIQRVLKGFGRKKVCADAAEILSLMNRCKPHYPRSIRWDFHKMEEFISRNCSCKKEVKEHEPEQIKNAIQP